MTGKRISNMTPAASSRTTSDDMSSDTSAVIDWSSTAGVASAEADLLLHRARNWWQLGAWDQLAALADRIGDSGDNQDLATHPDRARLARLALLAAAGCFQTGAAETARRLLRQALGWGCDRRIIARILLEGSCNSLGRVASLLEDEERARTFFEQAVGQHSRSEITVRVRNIQEKAKLNLLPEAAKLLGNDLQHSATREKLPDPDRQILDLQMHMLNQALNQALQRGQIYAGVTANEKTEEARSEEGEGRDLAGRSVSQLGQDLWVLEQTGYKRGGFFVEFGATDGIQLSNSLLLESGFGWSGICAEPNPLYFERLKQNRCCTVVADCILGRTGDKVEFLLADEFGGVSEFTRHDPHDKRRDPFRELGLVMEVETISLDDFLKKYDAPRQIDYLSIDTEGSEYEILSHFPIADWDIRLMTIEHNFTAMRSDLRMLMEANGYRCVEMKWDDWYIKQSPTSK